MGKTNKSIKTSITLFVGVTFAYFIWLTWKKLTEYVGDSDTIWVLTGIILVVALILGYFSFDKIAKKFT